MMRRLRLIEPALGLTLAAAVLFIACDKDPVANGDPFEPIEPINLPVVGHGIEGSRFAAEVAVRGSFAYTTTWSQRFAPGNTIFLWDIAGMPLLADSILVPNAVTLGDVQISDDGSLLVVATERSPGSIVIYDRSQPDALIELSRFSSMDTDPGVHTVKLGRVDGREYAFLAVNASSVPSKLVIVDITDPEDPVQVLVRPMNKSNYHAILHDTYVRDGILFTARWDAGLSIWDIGGGGRGGTVEAPVLISEIETVGGNVHNAWWFHNPNDNEKKYVVVGEEADGSAIGSSSAGDVHVVDISDIENPVEVAFYHVQGAGTHNFSMDEPSEMLYAAFYNGGVRALDVSGDLSVCTDSARASDNRCDLGRAGRVAGVALSTGFPPVSIWGVAVDGNRLYASDMLSGLYVLDISDLKR
jgi:hypothetical protein